MPVIRGGQLVDILKGVTKEPAKTMVVAKQDKTEEVVINPAFESWLIKDQQLLGYLLNSLTKDVLAQVAILTTAARVWASLGCSLPNPELVQPICACSWQAARKVA
jgi:hypothetical protein